MRLIYALLLFCQVENSDEIVRLNKYIDSLEIELKILQERIIDYQNLDYRYEFLKTRYKTKITTDFSLSEPYTFRFRSIKQDKQFRLYYLNAINSNYNFYYGLSSIKNKMIFGYKYQPKFKMHYLEFGLRIF